MYNEPEQPKNKIREKIDTILINNVCDISNIVIDALSQKGFELDITNVNKPCEPQKQEINIYRIR